MVSRACLDVNYPDSIRHSFWVSNSSTVWLVNPKPWKILGPWASEPFQKTPATLENITKTSVLGGPKKELAGVFLGASWSSGASRTFNNTRRWVPLATASPLLPRLVGKREFQGTIALQPLQIVPYKSLEIQGFVHETFCFTQNQFFWFTKCHKVAKKTSWKPNLWIVKKFLRFFETFCSSISHLPRGILVAPCGWGAIPFFGF